jgi:hypothetical protein
MIVIITSIIISLTVLVSAFIGFTPNLLHLVESDFQRRAVANAKMEALSYGQLGVRAGSLTTGEPVTIGRQFTFPPAALPATNCPPCTGNTCPPATPTCLPTTNAPTQGDGAYLYKIDTKEQDCMISAVSYGPASSPQLTAVTGRVIKPNR